MCSLGYTYSMRAGNSKERSSASVRFKRVRADHSTEVAQDYVELILDEIDLDGRAQLSELAQMLGVAHPTVSKALKRLEKLGLVAIRPYQQVELTAKGHKLAVAGRRRHATLVKFLVALGVDKETAEVDAEGIEHHVSAKTMAAFEKFLKHK